NSLALLRHAKLPELCQAQLAHPRFVVRQAAVRSLADALLSEDVTPPALMETARSAARLSVVEADQRVRRQAMRILARLEPQLAAQQMLQAYELHDTVAEIDRPLWAEVVANEEQAFNALLELSPQLTLSQLVQLG